MARSTKRVPVTGKVGPNYWTVDAMPWADIEEQTGVNFSEESRREIHWCTYWALAERDVASSSPTSGDVDALRAQIIHHATAILEITRKYRTPEGLPLVTGGQLVDETAEATYVGVALTTGDPTFKLTKHLLAAAAACEDLANGLAKPRSTEHDTARSPDVVSLAHFVALAIKGATRTRARTTPGYQKKPTAFEHRRWGLHLSAKAGHLPALCSAIFQGEVTQGQIQHAFATAQELGLIERQE